MLGSATAGRRVFDALGFSVEDWIAFLAQIEQQGGNSEKVLAALGTGFTRLAADTKNPEQALERVAERIREARTDTEALQIAIDAFGSPGLSDPRSIGPLYDSAWRVWRANYEGN